ncbi:MAG: ATP-binding cassette domain-containing protein [Planctomycetota bacterium]
MTPDHNDGLEIESVGFAYPRSPRLFTIDSLAISSGEVHALTGPSGVGKSTLLSIIAGLLMPACGTVRLRGQTLVGDGSWLPPERRRIGFVFQDCQLFPHLSAERNVAFGIRGFPKRQRREAAVRLLESLGVAHRADARPHELSGGERHRVAVARALGIQPHAMLLDEPFRSLDDRTAAATRDAVIGVLRASRVPTLMVTHDCREAQYACDSCWSLAFPVDDDRSRGAVLQPRTFDTPETALTLEGELAK